MIARFRFSAPLASTTIIAFSSSSSSPLILSSFRFRPTRIGGKVAPTPTTGIRSQPQQQQQQQQKAVVKPPPKKPDPWKSVVSSTEREQTTQPLKERPPPTSPQSAPLVEEDNGEFSTALFAEEESLAPSISNPTKDKTSNSVNDNSRWAPLKQPEFLELLKGIRVLAGPTVSTPEHLMRTSHYDDEVLSRHTEPKDIILLFHELANSAMRGEQLLAVTGQTGVGKSSIVPLLLSALLEDATVNPPLEEKQSNNNNNYSNKKEKDVKLRPSCIWMTQPTRAACIGLVQYMSQLSGTVVGQEIGYGTGEGSNFNLYRTKILICTPGYAARYLSNNHHSSPSSSAAAESNNRHQKRNMKKGTAAPAVTMGCHTMIIDEAHSVDEHLEVLLTVCALQLRDSTSMVFMSATMDFPVLQRLFAVSHRKTARALNVSQPERYLRYVFQWHQLPRVLASPSMPVLPRRFVEERLVPSLRTIERLSVVRAASGIDDKMVMYPHGAFKDLAEMLVRLACASMPRSGKRHSKEEQRSIINKIHKRDTNKKSRKARENEHQEGKESSNNDQDEISSVLVFLPGFQEMQLLTGQLFRSFRAYTSVDTDGAGDVLYMSRFHVEAPRRFFSGQDADYRTDDEWFKRTGKIQFEDEVGDEVVEVMLAHGSVVGNALGAAGGTSFGFDFASEYGETPWFLKGRRGANKKMPSSASRTTTIEDKTVVPSRTFRGRTIVLATNVAESSLTIPHLKYIVDLGLERYEVRSRAVANSSYLATRWISETSAAQRAGRVGRLCDGFVMRLYPPHVLRRQHVGVDTGRDHASQKEEDGEEGQNEEGQTATARERAPEDDDEARTTVLVKNDTDAERVEQDEWTRELSQAAVRSPRGDQLQQQQTKRTPAHLSQDSSEFTSTFMIERLLLAAFALPAIARNYSLSELRSCWIHQVSSTVVSAAVERMCRDGLLVSQPSFKSGYALTRAGSVVSHLPMSLQMGRFIWYSLAFGCAVDALLVAGVLTASSADLFVVNTVRRMPEDPDGEPLSVRRPPPLSSQHQHQHHRRLHQQQQEMEKEKEEKLLNQDQKVEVDGRSVWEIEAELSTKGGAAAAAAAEEGDANDGSSSNTCSSPSSTSKITNPATISNQRRPLPVGASSMIQARQFIDAYKNMHFAQKEYGVEEHLSEVWMLRQLVADWLSLPRRSMRRRQSGHKAHFETRYLQPQTVFVDRSGIRGRRMDAVDATVIRCARGLDEALTAGEADGVFAGGAASAEKWRDELSQLRALQVLVRTGCAIGDKQLEAAEALFGPLPERASRGPDEPFDDEEIQDVMRRPHYVGRFNSRQAVRVNEELRRSRLLLAFAAAFGDKVLVGAPSEGQYNSLFARSTGTASNVVMQQLQQRSGSSLAAAAAESPLPSMMANKTDESLLVVRTPNAVISESSSGSTSSTDDEATKKKRRLLQLPPDVFKDKFLRQFVRPALHKKMQVDVRGSVSFVSLGTTQEQQLKPNKKGQEAQHEQQQESPYTVRYDLNRPPPTVSFAPLETMRTQCMLLGSGHSTVTQVRRAEFVEAPSMAGETAVSTDADADADQEKQRHEQNTATGETDLGESLPTAAELDDWIVVPLSPPRPALQRTVPRSPAAEDAYRVDRKDGRWIAFRKSAVANLGMEQEVEEVSKIATVLAPTMAELMMGDEQQEKEHKQTLTAAAAACDDDLIVDDEPSTVTNKEDEEKEIPRIQHEQQEQQQQQQPPSSFVDLYPLPQYTHVLHHPNFYLLGRYSGGAAERRLAVAQRFRTGQALSLLGTLATTQRGSSTSAAGGYRDVAIEGDAAEMHETDHHLLDSFPSSSSASSSSSQRALLTRRNRDSSSSSSSSGDKQRLLLRLIEEETNAVGSEEDERDLQDEQKVVRVISEQQQQHPATPAVKPFSSGDGTSEQSTTTVSAAATPSASRLYATAVSTAEASGVHVLRIKRQHCALCGKVVPRLSRVPGHRYSTRHLRRLLLLLHLKISLPEVCRIFSSDSFSNVVALQQQQKQKQQQEEESSPSSNNREHRLDVIESVPSSSFATTVHLPGTSHLRGLRLQPSFAGGRAMHTRAGWNDGVIFGFAAALSMPPPARSLTRSGFARHLWLLPPPSHARLSAPPLVDDLMSSMCIGGASARNPIRLLVEATSTNVVALVAVQAFPFPPMALREPTPLQDKTVAAFLETLAMTQDSLSAVHGVRDAQRLRRMVFQFLNKNAVPAVKKKQQDNQRDGEENENAEYLRVVVSSTSADGSTAQREEEEPERIWVRFETSSPTQQEQGDQTFTVNVSLPGSPFDPQQATMLQTEARLLNAVLMSLTADTADGRITVDRIVRRYADQMMAQQQQQQQQSTEFKRSSAFHIPANLSNADALRALDELVFFKGYASVHELLVLACGAVPLEAQLGAMVMPSGVEDRDVSCGAMLLSRMMLPSRIVTREEALRTTEESNVRK